jgi:GTP cyclohydrolase I
MFDRDRDEDNLDIQVAMHLHTRQISEEQMRKFENDVSAILTAFGLDLDESSPLTRTTFWRGEYESNAELRTEFFNMCGVRL